jgi:hypothetical protein
MEEADQSQSIALSLSGGGFRASLFHLGVIRALWERDRLGDVREIVGVSGGAILAAHLRVHWPTWASRNPQDFNAAAADFLRITTASVSRRILHRMPWRYLLFNRFTFAPYFLGPMVKRRYEALHPYGSIRSSLLVHELQRFLGSTPLNQCVLDRDVEAVRVALEEHRSADASKALKDIVGRSTTPEMVRGSCVKLAARLATPGASDVTAAEIEAALARPAAPPPTLHLLATNMANGLPVVFSDVGIYFGSRDGEDTRDLPAQTRLVPRGTSAISASIAAAASAAFPAFPALRISMGELGFAGDNPGDSEFVALSDGGMLDNAGSSVFRMFIEEACARRREASREAYQGETDVVVPRVPPILIVSDAGLPLERLMADESFGTIRSTVRATDILMSLAAAQERNSPRTRRLYRRNGTAVVPIDITREDKHEVDLSIKAQRALRWLRTDLDYFNETESDALVAHGRRVALLSIPKECATPLDPPPQVGTSSWLPSRELPEVWGKTSPVATISTREKVYKRIRHGRDHLILSGVWRDRLAIFHLIAVFALIGFGGFCGVKWLLPPKMRHYTARTQLAAVPAHWSSFLKSRLHDQMKDASPDKPSPTRKLVELAQKIAARRRLDAPAPEACNDDSTACAADRSVKRLTYVLHYIEDPPTDPPDAFQNAAKTSMVVLNGGADQALSLALSFSEGTEAARCDSNDRSLDACCDTAPPMLHNKLQAAIGNKLLHDAETLTGIERFADELGLLAIGRALGDSTSVRDTRLHIPNEDRALLRSYVAALLVDGRTVDVDFSVRFLPGDDRLVEVTFRYDLGRTDSRSLSAANLAMTRELAMRYLESPAPSKPYRFVGTVDPMDSTITAHYPDHKEAPAATQIYEMELVNAQGRWKSPVGTITASEGAGSESLKFIAAEK